MSIEEAARALIASAEWAAPAGPVIVNARLFLELTDALSIEEAMPIDLVPDPALGLCAGCDFPLTPRDASKGNGKHRFCRGCRDAGVDAKVRQRQYRERQKGQQ